MTDKTVGHPFYSLTTDEYRRVIALDFATRHVGLGTLDLTIARDYEQFIQTGDVQRTETHSGEFHSPQFIRLGEDK